MSQRIFDMENEQDVKDLFDILPPKAINIRPNGPYTTVFGRGEYITVTNVFMINWRGKISVDRPVDKSKWIGCLCLFWDGDDTDKHIGFLKEITDKDDYAYVNATGVNWPNCRPVKREEIKFVEDEE